MIFKFNNFFISMCARKIFIDVYYLTVIDLNELFIISLFTSLTLTLTIALVYMII